MKTIFHDNESGTKLEMEGTFGNSKARLVDDEGNVTTELEGSYSEILEMINKLSGINEQEKEEPQEACEDVAEYEEPLTNSDFRGAKVKVLEDITDEYEDTLDKGTITTDVNVLHGDNLLINRVIVKPDDFKKLEKRKKDTPSFKIGETVEVKEGKDCSGAVGYAILTDIEEREVILQGFNKDGEFFDSWHNDIDNIKKVDK